MSSALRCCLACGAVYGTDFSCCANDGHQLIVTTIDPLLRTVLGGYHVDELLGEGGMARVYRAHHQHLVQRHYALKVLRGELAATMSTRVRFEREAEAASRMQHPNVVTVVDYGCTDAGLTYLVMDLVRGPTLTELVQCGPMAPERVIGLARGLCAGLAHAHDHGLIHRDFKPDNILVVERDGVEVPRIVDFGLAITRDHDEVRLTETGFVMGTAAYVAPEQCEHRRIDHRADLYALGVTMFEMLTGGRLPFDGSTPQIIGLKVTRSAPSLAEVMPAGAVPPGLAAVVARLLERDPDDRFPDARSVAAALDRVTLAIGSPARTAKLRRPRRGLAIAAGCLALPIVGLLAWPRGAAHVADAPVAPPPPIPPPPAAIAVAAPTPAPASVSPAPVRAKPQRARVRPRPQQATPPEPQPAPILEPPPVAIAPARALTPGFARLDVSGSLSVAVVRRALERTLPALRACSVTTHTAIDVRFSIGENRRVSGVRTSSRGAAASCVVAAIATARVEAAPDVGDVAVVVRVSFD